MPNVIIVNDVLTSRVVYTEILSDELGNWRMAVHHQDLDVEALSLCQWRHSPREAEQLARIAAASFVRLKIEHVCGVYQMKYGWL